MTVIVTKQSLNEMLADDRKRPHVIGRALVALFNRQTEHEQSANATAEDNGVGFAGCDARSGSLTAKTYIKNRTLQQWQVDKWMKESRGYPRICKYAGQLNEITLERRRKEQAGQLATLRQQYGIDRAVDQTIVTEIHKLEQALGAVA